MQRLLADRGCASPRIQSPTHVGSFFFPQLQETGLTPSIQQTLKAENLWNKQMGERMKAPGEEPFLLSSSTHPGSHETLSQSSGLF